MLTRTTVYPRFPQAAGKTAGEAKKVVPNEGTRTSEINIPAVFSTVLRLERAVRGTRGFIEVGG